jgi:16S rRNA (uracil1498-N3)-methyltransferase
LGRGGDDLTGLTVPLSEEDSHHAVRVLRLAPGDKCEVVVGAAVYAAAVVEEAVPLKVRLDERLQGEAAGAAYRMQVGLVQDIDRPALVDVVIEKGTEAGASFFLLLPSARPSRVAASAAASRLLRWERIAREAAKQSKQVVIPRLEACASIDAALATLEARGARSIVLDPGAPQRLDQLLRPTATPRSPGPRGAEEAAGLALWVGSEGGWTDQERERFSNAGLATARLGRSVLRTETAGPVAVAVARLALGDW